MSGFRVAWALSVASIPLALAIYGWASHWNAYTNLILTLSSVVLWVVAYVSLQAGS